MFVLLIFSIFSVAIISGQSLQPYTEQQQQQHFDLNDQQRGYTIRYLPGYFDGQRLYIMPNAQLQLDAAVPSAHPFANFDFTNVANNEPPYYQQFEERTPLGVGQNPQLQQFRSSGDENISKTGPHTFPSTPPANNVAQRASSVPSPQAGAGSAPRTTSLFQVPFKPSPFVGYSQDSAEVAAPREHGAPPPQAASSPSSSSSTASQRQREQVYTPQNDLRAIALGQYYHRYMKPIHERPAEAHNSVDALRHPAASADATQYVYMSPNNIYALFRSNR